MKKGMFLFVILILILTTVVTAVNIHPKVREYFDAGISSVDVILVYSDKSKLDFLGNDFKVKHNYNVNQVAGSLTKKGYNKIIENDIVNEVEFDMPVQAFLTISVPQINATAVHNLVFDNINVTGKNIGVCVLDSGVNYSIDSLGGCFGVGCKVNGGYDIVNGDSDPIDDFGHGTPITSIIASNHSTNKGVAFDANIFHVKVLNQFGAGLMSDTQEAIEMCVGNATLYNISVVSMSFGTNVPMLYDTYCDSSFPSYANVVNDAVGKNITVVVSTGNDGNKTHISLPACIQNVTAIGAVNSGDAVPSFSNMNSLVDFVMPGASITMPGISGGLVTKSGTSFSVPHLSGVIALLQSYKKAERGFGFSYDELMNILKSTSINVSDGSVIYYRADAFEAIKKADERKPQVDLNNPLNKTYSLGENITVEFDATDMMLGKCWYDLNGVIEIPNCKNFNLSLNTKGSFEMTLFANDSHGNKNSDVISFTVNEGFGVDVIKPVNGSALNKGNVVLEYGTYGDVNSCYYNLNNGVNITLSGCVNTTLSLADNIYDLNLYVTNTLGLVNYTNVNFEVDTLLPALTVVSPLNNDIFAGNVLIDITSNGSNCYYNLNNSVNTVIDNCDSVTVTPTDFGDYNLTVYANDTAGNVNLSVLNFGFAPEIPSVTLTIPNGFKTNSSELNLTCDVIAENITKVELYHNVNQNFSSAQIKYYNGVKSGFNFTVTGLNTGSYNWNCLATDRDNDTRFAVNNNSFAVDLEQPVIALLEPNNTVTLASGSNIIFRYNVTDENVVEKCELTVDNNPDKQDIVIIKGTEETFQDTLSSGQHQWYITCNDDFGNFRISEKRNMTVQAAASSTPSTTTSTPPTGGGGGGGGSTTNAKESSNEESSPSEANIRVGKETSSTNENGITGASVSNVEKLAEQKSWLKKGLGLLLGSDTNIVGFAVKESKPVDDVKVERVLEGINKVSWKLKYNGKENINNVVVYDEVPKSFASSSDKIEVSGDIKSIVVEKDPVFMYDIGELKSGSEYKFAYVLKEGSVKEDVLKDFKDPVILSTPEKPTNKWWKYWWVFVLIVIIFSFWFGIGILMGHDYENKGPWEKAKEEIYAIIDKIFRRY